MYESHNGSKYINEAGWTVIPLEDKLHDKRFREAFKDHRNTLMANGRFACSVNDKVTLLRYAKRCSFIVYWVWMGVHESHMFTTLDAHTMDKLIAILTGDEKQFEKADKIARLELKLEVLDREIRALKFGND